MPVPQSPSTPSNSVGWGGSLRLLLPLLAFRALMLWLVYGAFILIPFIGGSAGYDRNFHWPADKPMTAETAYETWDAQHYLFISQFGYAKIGSRPFYPLWPAVIHVATIAFSDPLTAGLIAANLFSTMAIILLHRLAALRGGIAQADAAVLLLLSFPSAFFLMLPYSEAFFMLLIVGLFLALQCDRPKWVWFLGLLLPLTRSVGIFCLAPIIVDQWLKRRPARAIVLGSGPVIGLLLYFIVFLMLTGDPLAGMRASPETTYGSLAHMLHPLQFLSIFFNREPGALSVFISPIDRIVLIAVVLAIIPMIRRDRPGAAYCIPAVIVPAMTMSMMSFARFALVLPPVYLIGGQWFSSLNRRWWLWLICAAGYSIQLILLIRHVHFAWAD